MTPEDLIILVACVSFSVSLLWIMYTVKRGRGFYTKIETGSKRLDTKLLMYIVIEAFTIGGVFVLLLGNFAFFIFTKTLVFGPTLSALSLIVVFIFSLFYVLDHIYNFAKDKAEKPTCIRRVKRKKQKNES